jgi:hypothetical protein
VADREAPVRISAALIDRNAVKSAAPLRRDQRLSGAFRDVTDIDRRIIAMPGALGERRQKYDLRAAWLLKLNRLRDAVRAT